VDSKRPTTEAQAEEGDGRPRPERIARPGGGGRARAGGAGAGGPGRARGPGSGRRKPGAEEAERQERRRVEVQGGRGRGSRQQRPRCTAGVGGGTGRAGDGLETLGRPARQIGSLIGAPAFRRRRVRRRRGVAGGDGVGVVAGRAGGQPPVGLSLPPPAALVDRPMMGPPHQHQVGQVGGAAVQPGPQTMGLTPGQRPSTAGDHTAAVAHGQGGALGGLHDPGGPDAAGGRPGGPGAAGCGASRRWRGPGRRGRPRRPRGRARGAGGLPGGRPAAAAGGPARPEPGRAGRSGSGWPAGRRRRPGWPGHRLGGDGTGRQAVPKPGRGRGRGAGRLGGRVPGRVPGRRAARGLADGPAACSGGWLGDGPIEYVFESMGATYQPPTTTQAANPELWTRFLSGPPLAPTSSWRQPGWPPPWRRAACPRTRSCWR
jgi:hypothetical protein